MTSLKSLLPCISTLTLTLTLGLGVYGCAGEASDSGGNNVGFGGAQDIGQFRDILDRGEVPAPETLDANGFFSEHYTELPPADCGLALCLHGMVSVNPSWSDNASQTVVRVALNTSIVPEDLEAKPRDLIVVVDTSGSMAEDERMVYVKQGMDLLIDDLGEGDRIGIVSYDFEGEVRAELGELSKAELHGVVESLQPDGGTNIFGGLELGMQMAANSYSAERQARVILLSDGNITAGPNAGQVALLSESYVSEGIGLTTIGVGNSFNVELMRGLAESGSGNFYYLEDAAAVSEVFTQELAYFASPIALDLEVRVQGAESHRLGKVVGSSLWMDDAISDPELEGGTSGSLRVPALFLASRVDTEEDPEGRRGGGSSLYIALERRAGVPVGTSLAKLSATFRLPGSDEIITQEIDVLNTVGDDLPESGYVSHLEMLKAYAVYNFYLGFMQACQEAQNSYPQALETVQALQATATEWNTRVPDADISDDLALLAQFELNLQGLGGGEYGDEYGDDYAYESPVMCSGAGGTRSSLLFAMLLLAALCLGARTRES